MVSFSPTKHQYPSIRNVVYGKNGMVACTQPLASSIGINVLKSGGNAMDAAVAMAAAMPLLEPTANGLGSDAFALIWSKDKIYGLNASGYSPKALNGKVLKDKGLTAIPGEGWFPVMVPGCIGGWQAIHDRFGTKPYAELFAPTIRYAREGFPVAVNVAIGWEKDVERIGRAHKKDPEVFQPWLDTFAPGGKAPKAGEIFCNPGFADTLEELAATDCESYYRGRIMKKIVDFSKKTGGYFEGEDFTSYHAQWVEPISTNYRGYTVFELPPNGHGITALMALQILNGLDLGKDRENEAAYHKQIEALKLAFVDTKKYVADPRYMKTKVEDLLSDRYTESRRSLIGEKALLPEAGDPSSGGTVYFCCADGEGNMVSYIQSNFAACGSGVCIPGTGISLQNRGLNFSLDETSDNYFEGGKKAYHTIIPGFLAKDGKAIGPFGVMGGFMQPQGHVQVVVNTVDYGLSPQDALDAPRWQWVGDKKVQLEREVPAHIALALADRGHQIEVMNSNRTMGRGQIIWKLDNGVLVGGTESRADGAIAAF